MIGHDRRRAAAINVPTPAASASTPKPMTAGENGDPVSPNGPFGGCVGRSPGEEFDGGADGVDLWGLAGFGSVRAGGWAWCAR
jgi:hypothetical protein